MKWIFHKLMELQQILITERSPNRTGKGFTGVIQKQGWRSLLIVPLIPQTSQQPAIYYKTKINCTPMKRNRSPNADDSLKDSKKDHKQSCPKQPDPGALELFINNSRTIDVLKAKGVKSLFPIQYYTFYDVHKGTDLLARDRTGSGKTLAYSLPIIERFREHRIFGQDSIKMLVLLPTRQLAVQVASEIESLKNEEFEYRVAMAFGGTSVSEQRNKILAGCDFLVATPGRLLDFMEKGIINTSNLLAICLDEADEMLKMGFKQQVDKILKQIKESSKSYQVQTLLFSATLPDWIVTLSRVYLMPNHKVVNMIAQQSNSCSTTIKHYKVECARRNRVGQIQKLIGEFIEKEGRCFIFCETKKETSIMQTELGYIMREPVHGLHGDIAQEQRLRTFDALKMGKLRFVVATNVAARGLDVPNIELVIQCSPTKDTETYIHRAGRTGRAGKAGTCVVLHTEDEEYLVAQIASKAKIEINSYQFKGNQRDKGGQRENQRQRLSPREEECKISDKPDPKYIKGGEFHCVESKPSEENAIAKFKISVWRKVNVTSMELQKYLKQVIDFCEITTKIDDKNSLRASIYFQVPEKFAERVNRLADQFKTDGYYVEQVHAPSVKVDYNSRSY